MSTQDPTKITETVFTQYRTILDESNTNMLNKPGVKKQAKQRDFEELYSFIKSDADYQELVMNFESYFRKFSP